MPVGAALAVAGVGGALIGANASTSAASTQAQAATQAGQYQLEQARLAAQLQLGMFNTIRGDLSSYRNVGTSALPSYYRLLGLPAPTNTTTTTQNTNVVPGAGGTSYYNVPSAGGAPAPGIGAGGGLVIPGINDGGAGVSGGSYAGVPGFGLGGAGGAGGVAALAGVPGAPGGTGSDPNAAGGWYGTAPNADWTSFLNNPANADILAWAQSGHGDPNTPIEQQSMAQRAAYWYWHAGTLGDPRAQTALPTQAATTPGSPGATGTTPGTPGPNGPSLTGDPGTGTGDIESYLSSLPGYQFVKSQGVKAVTDALSARGLGGDSGSMVKGISRFVTGLADQTYADQLSRLGGAVSVGQNASTQTGTFGTAAASGGSSALMGGAQAYGNSLVGAANASAAGTVGSANAIAGGANSLANAFLTSRILGNTGGTNFLPSDRRLKRDIVKVGELPNGIGIYFYRYLWSPVLWLGVMAQEVLKVKPEAVARMPNGYLAVDYGRL